MLPRRYVGMVSAFSSCFNSPHSLPFPKKTKTNSSSSRIGSIGIAVVAIVARIVHGDKNSFATSQTAIQWIIIWLSRQDWDWVWAEARDSFDSCESSVAETAEERTSESDRGNMWNAWCEWGPGFGLTALQMELSHLSNKWTRNGSIYSIHESDFRERRARCHKSSCIKRDTRCVLRSMRTTVRQRQRSADQRKWRKDGTRHSGTPTPAIENWLGHTITTLIHNNDSFGMHLFTLHRCQRECEHTAPNWYYIFDQAFDSTSTWNSIQCAFRSVFRAFDYFLCRSWIADNYVRRTLGVCVSL